MRDDHVIGPTHKSPGIMDVLPSMQRDIVLERPPPDDQHTSRHITVVDTKFTSILTPGHYRNQTLVSGYIYQMYAYLMSQERKADPSSLDSTGVLLHPSLGRGFDEFAVIQGHKIRCATVDLASDSKTIRRQLLRIVE